MSQLFANAARSPLMANILAGDTSLTVDAALADLFPVADTGTDPVPTVGKDFFKIVLENAAHEKEIVYVRTRALGDPIFSNVIRGQEGTTARAYTTGDIVGLRHTAVDLADAIDLAANATTAGKALLNAANAAAQRVALAFSTFFSTLIGAADANELRGLIGVPGVGKNLLINGNFTVNQREYVSAAATTVANQYTLDRWRVVTSGQNLAFAASGNGNQVTAPAGGIEQVIEGANVGGGQYVINWVGTATCTVDGVAKTKGATFTLTANTNCTVKFIGGTVSQAQVEYGPAPTSFEHRPASLELALCQRYYEKSGTNPTWCGDAQNTGIYYYAVSMVPKRAAPTVVTADIVSSGFPAGAPSVGAITTAMFQTSKTCNSAGGARYYQFQWTADAEL